MLAIDFGTTRTKAAYLHRDGDRVEARLALLGDSDAAALPSLFYVGADGVRLVGAAAQALIEADPAGAVVTLKRQLRERVLRKNGQRVAPVELLAALLREIRQRVTEELPELAGVAPDSVVLTLPAAGAGAGPVVETLMRQAAIEAGFARVELVSEPEAAAEAWRREAGETGDDVLVVLDCGGGTVDWACLHRVGGRLVRHTECPAGGDSQVGGEWVDDELLALVREEITASGDAAALADLERRAPWVLGQLRAMRERFCHSGGGPLLARDQLVFAGRKVALGVEAVRAVLAERFVEQVCAGFGRYLDQVRATTGAAAPKVLLVGGAARILGLKEALAERCACAPVRWQRSEYATVLGAAWVGVEEQPVVEVPAHAPVVVTAPVVVPPVQSEPVAVAVPMVATVAQPSVSVDAVPVKPADAAGRRSARATWLVAGVVAALAVVGVVLWVALAGRQTPESRVARLAKKLTEPADPAAVADLLRKADPVAVADIVRKVKAKAAVEAEPAADRYRPVAPDEVKVPADGTRNTVAYRDNGDGTVWDPALGLTWQRGDSGKDLTWAHAKAYCADLSLAGSSEWRLPTVFELLSLVDKSRPVGKRIALEFENSGSWHWSGSQYQPSPSSNAWSVNFYNGYSYNNGITYNNRVRCVR